MNSTLTNPTGFQVPTTIFVGDADNLSHIKGRRGIIDQSAFGALLKMRHTAEAVMIGNWFTREEVRTWARANVQCLSTWRNADAVIRRELMGYVHQGAKHLILGSGDGRAFTKLVREFAQEGVSVHVISNRESLSPDLRAAAAGFAYANKFIHFDADERGQLAA